MCRFFFCKHKFWNQSATNKFKSNKQTKKLIYDSNEVLRLPVKVVIIVVGRRTINTSLCSHFGELVLAVRNTLLVGRNGRRRRTRRRTRIDDLNLSRRSCLSFIYCLFLFFCCSTLVKKTFVVGNTELFLLARLVFISGGLLAKINFAFGRQAWINKSN